MFCSWNVLQDKLKDNPHWEKCVTAPAIVGDHVTAKTDGGMKEVFSKIAEKHPNSVSLQIDLVIRVTQRLKQKRLQRNMV